MSAQDILAALESDFKQKIEGDLIAVKWPEAGRDIYVRPKCSAFKKQPILAAAAASEFDKMNALMVIQFALDENGKSIFSRGHVDALIKKTDSQVLDRVAGDISAAINFDSGSLEDGYTGVDEAEKNSQSQPSYTSNSN